MGEYLIPEKEFINTLSEKAISVTKLFDYVKNKKRMRNLFIRQIEHACVYK